VGQDPPVIANTDHPIRQEEIPLRVDIDQNLFPLGPDHLHHHPTPAFPASSDPTEGGFA
jgi:hypothetical protein